MKIVIINDFSVQGGTEVQCIREKEILESYGHEVYLITFDKNFSAIDNNFNLNKNYINIIASENYYINKYSLSFCNISLLVKVRALLNKIEPNVIHVNNLNQYPNTLYRALKGFKVVQTVRDYSAVCIKATCIYKNCSVCSGFTTNDCIANCKSNFSKSNINAKWHMYKFKRNQRLRTKYVNKFISPSLMLKSYLVNNGYSNVSCVNDCFDFSLVKNIKRNSDIVCKKYFYFGNITKIKGIFRLLDVFKTFSQDKNVKLIIAGKALGKDLELLNMYTNENKKINYLGYLEYKDILNELSSVYSVIVPSLWMENYPNTVLEAMATRCLVLGSDRGGIPEMIEGRGLIYNVMDNSSIFEALESSYNMAVDDYNILTCKALEYVHGNNNISKYYMSLLRLFTE